MSAEKTTIVSTARITGKQFQAHGQVDIWMDGDLLHYVATGPFNRELIDCLAIAQLEFLQSMHPNGPWVSVCDVKKSAVGGPDTLERYAEIMRAPKPHGLTPVGTAFVIGPDVEGGRLMGPLFAQIFADIQRPFRIFQTMAEAQTWARDMIEEAKLTGVL